MNKTILVVDDSEFDRALLVKALSRKGGFDVIEAADGAQCLEIIAKQTIDLILMDVMMPGKFGTHVLMNIREKFNQIELPIIMVTSKGDTADVVGCLQGGANDYILKPVNFDVAVSRISTHLKLGELSKEMSKLQELAALDAMITTYNHEINNPLAIAIACLSDSVPKDEANFERLKKNLWRVADIVKRIGEITQKKEIEYHAYVKERKMVKLP